MKTFKQYLGPEATKSKDGEEVARQKAHLTDKAKENHEQSAHERMFGHGGAAEAKAKSYENARDNIGEEMGAGAVPVNSVAGVAGTGDSRLPSNQREPGVTKKNPFRRKQPKV